MFNTTGIDFYETEDLLQQREILQPIITEFIHQGFQNIPDWQELAAEMKRLIRKNGWRDRPVDQIAMDAARAVGYEYVK